MPPMMPNADPAAQSVGGPQQAQPPMGSSPATVPTQNKGYEAAGLQQLGVIVSLMEKTIPLLGSASEPGKDLLKALSTLSKHIPPGAVSPAAQQNTMQSLMMKQAQMGPQIQAMRQQSMAPPQGGASPMPAAA